MFSGKCSGKRIQARHQSKPETSCVLCVHAVCCVLSRRLHSTQWCIIAFKICRAVTFPATPADTAVVLCVMHTHPLTLAQADAFAVLHPWLLATHRPRMYVAGAGFRFVPAARTATTCALLYIAVFAGFGSKFALYMKGVYIAAIHCVWDAVTVSTARITFRFFKRAMQVLFSTRSTVQ